MSLFEDPLYRWRETYFVLFPAASRPSAEEVKESLLALGRRYQIREMQADEEGLFESLTLLSSYDHAAMDVTCLAGEEVVDQVKELVQQMSRMTLTDEERGKLNGLAGCDARFEVYHFAELSDDGDEEEDDSLDPGTLLIVLETLVESCNGISIDPQSGTFM